jgi:hypothetical protein
VDDLRQYHGMYDVSTEKLLNADHDRSRFSSISPGPRRGHGARAWAICCSPTMIAIGASSALPFPN